MESSCAKGVPSDRMACRAARAPDIMGMIRLIAVAALALSGCASAGGGDVATQGPSPFRPIYTGTYTGTGTERPAAPAAERRESAPERRADTAKPDTAKPDASKPDGERPPPRRRSGGSIPPPYGSSPTAPPAVAPLPGPGDTTDSTAAFKRDLLAPKIDDLRTRDALNQLDPIQQRDLLMQQQEMHRLQTDPLRR